MDKTRKDGDTHTQSPHSQRRTRTAKFALLMVVTVTAVVDGGGDSQLGANKEQWKLVYTCGGGGGHQQHRFSPTLHD